MKHFLLSKNGNFYKANLHSHSTVSDGTLTPEQMKKVYKDMGYSVVAFTDHNVMIPHPELTDEDFLALNGYEFDFTGGGHGINYNDRKVCHLCLIALDPDERRQVCWTKGKHLYGNSPNYQNQVHFYGRDDYTRSYTAECINDVIAQGREHGFFVTYNHPSWSNENYEQYCSYEQLNAMEVANFGTQVTGHGDHNPRVYDDMLRSGKRIYCLATDDNHNLSDRPWDSGGAWVMIKADALEYRKITDALVAGNFYSSQGPCIQELWVEDGSVHITTSDAQQIFMTTANRRSGMAWAKEGTSLNEATFRLDRAMGYFRLTVVDHRGRCAHTNAYFLDEFNFM